MSCPRAFASWTIDRYGRKDVAPGSPSSRATQAFGSSYAMDPAYGCGEARVVDREPACLRSASSCETQNPRESRGILMVGDAGLEPTTSSV